MIINDVPQLNAKQELRFRDNIIFLDNFSCWFWIGSLFENSGYGRFSINSVYYPSHRIMYKLQYDKDIADKLICHTCDNPTCCNPAHLFEGTHKDNIQDCIKKGRFANTKGSNNNRAKLKEPDINEIRLKNLFGATINELSKEYNVKRTAISYIISGKSWIHV